MRIGTIPFLIAGALLLMGGSCPTIEPLEPSRLARPLRLPASIAGYRMADGYRSCIRVAWAPPDTNSVSVRSYTIIRAAGNDSVYTIVVRSIPPYITEYFDPVEEFYPETSGSTLLRYRVYAIDEYERSSDTSMADTVILQNRPVLVSPDPDDTISSPTFSWQIPGPLSGYFTYLFIWDTTGHAWQSPRPLTQLFPAPDMMVPHSVSVPDSVWGTFSNGMFYWGAKIDVVTGVRDVTAGGLVIRRGYVR